MLYVIWSGYNCVSQTRQENVVYIVSSVNKMLDLGIDFLFTDGHAIEGYTTFYEKTEVNNIETILDFDAIHAKYWKDEKDLDKKRKKSAEFLVATDLPYESILGYVVYNEHAHLMMEKMNTQRHIVVKPEYYF